MTALEGHTVRDPHDLHARVGKQLDLAAEEVTRRFAGRADYESVRSAVAEAYEELARDAKFQSFLPILAARAAQQRLNERVCP
ncbi:hypothetical protein Lesp02_37570 [Lentzea sp. NBRC 105346]|uniref:three-helix bundle dimerization domain-containing protein n=1 Tax=Lentzea sp. NBRC 105346 TaxID=3032205 RepID=UPI0024A36590|nr:hypothetical protein [Lentzea sp. NBRC 105346]GLZ31569.1 hypothetical protein Lesp02_37570 [Lentzea sp. NBRC 105346]